MQVFIQVDMHPNTQTRASFEIVYNSYLYPSRFECKLAWISHSVILVIENGFVKILSI